jgi:hypothetical protein
MTMKMGSYSKDWRQPLYTALFKYLCFFKDFNQLRANKLILLLPMLPHIYVYDSYQLTVCFYNITHQNASAMFASLFSCFDMTSHIYLLL